jgi:hypothetical protein
MKAMQLNDTIVGVNLQAIAKKFSGMILFSGDGAVEIKEASCFYIFPRDEELNNYIEGDGEEPKFTTIHKYYEPDDGNELANFNIYSLEDTDSRCAHKIKDKLEDTKSYLSTLSNTEKEYFIKQLQKENF